ncbi:MAG: hypothetical protein IJ524_08345 [Bacteroidales bacterium]|nr:hypothetical protein [Bacteroidales bacterium]
MKQEDPLHELFAAYRPALGDGDAFMEHLQARMKAAEAVKRYAEERQRLNRHRLVVAFTVGAVLGAAAVVYTLLHPIIPQPTPNLPRMALWLQRMLPAATALAIAAISAAVATLSTLRREEGITS